MTEQKPGGALAVMEQLGDRALREMMENPGNWHGDKPYAEKVARWAAESGNKVAKRAKETAAMMDARLKAGGVQEPLDLLEVVELVRRGTSIAGACGILGVTRSTVYQREKTSQAFRSLLEHAREMGKASRIGYAGIRMNSLASNGDFRALKWMLENHDEEGNFIPKERRPTGPVNITLNQLVVAVGAHSPELAEAIRAAGLPEVLLLPVQTDKIPEKTVALEE